MAEKNNQNKNSLKLDTALRPTNLTDFIGQTDIVENLSIFINSASKREEPLDHVLLHGPPGLGKTTLAQIIAKESNVNFRATSGPAIKKPGDLAAILTNLQPRDILFIDEIHRLIPTAEETLYPAMEDRKIDIIIGEGPGAKSIQIDLNPFTLVGATTRSGLISNPLRDRFGIPIRLNFYSKKELKYIIRRGAKLLSLNMSEKGAEEIANRSRGTPRIAGRLLRRVRDIALVNNKSIIDNKIADEALNKLKIDKIGLDSFDRKYLSCVINNYNGGPVGIETIATALSEEKDTLEDAIEPYLIQLGFIKRSSRGRIALLSAWKHIKVSAPSSFIEKIEKHL